jgi:hypothetical protein
MENETEKRGRGKPKGSTSCVGIPLSELNKVFKEDAIILVSRTYLQFLNQNAVKTVSQDECFENDLNELDSEIKFTVS